MQFVSLALGFMFARPNWGIMWPTFLWAMLGTAMVSGGAAALNHYLEWPLDAMMERTKNRPIPTGRIRPWVAFLFAALLVALGLEILWVKVNVLTTILGFLTTALYVLVYTPLKQLTWWNTYMGALPGAIPPLGGWAAATGSLALPAFILGGILAIWQIPHFFAIAWMYQEDYAKAGFQMLPKFDPDGRRTVRQMVVSIFALIACSLLPVSLGLLSWVYGALATLLGAYFANTIWVFAKDRSKANAKKVLRASVIYLPLLLLAMAVDYALS